MVLERPGDVEPALEGVGSVAVAGVTVLDRGDAWASFDALVPSVVRGDTREGGAESVVATGGSCGRPLLGGGAGRVPGLLGGGLSCAKRPLAVVVDPPSSLDGVAAAASSGFALRKRARNPDTSLRSSLEGVAGLLALGGGAGLGPLTLSALDRFERSFAIRICRSTARKALFKAQV